MSSTAFASGITYETVLAGPLRATFVTLKLFNAAASATAARPASVEFPKHIGLVRSVLDGAGNTFDVVCNSVDH